MMTTASLLGTEFCTRFVLTLAHFLWQGAAIGLLAAVSTVIVRTPQRRYWVLCVFLLLTAVSPVMTFCLTGGSSLPTLASPAPSTRDPLPAAFARPSRRSVATTPVTVRPMLTQHIPKGSEGPRIALQGLAPYFTVAYVVGLSVMLARLLLGMRGAERLRSAAAPVTDTSVLAALEKRAAALGLACVPAVAYCQRVAVPTVVGLLRPMILLPLAMCNDMTVDQIEMILAHELAHIRRYDHLVNLTQRLIEAFLFFHPAVWLLSRRIRTERELCCDDLAVRTGGQALGYAACLVSLAKNAKATELAATVAIGSAGEQGRPSQLRQRVLRLVEGNTHERHAVSRTWLAAVAIACLSLIGGLGYLHAQEAKGRPKKTPKSAVSQQEPAQTAGRAPAGQSSRQKRNRSVEEALATHIDLDFADTPLTDVIAFLADVTKVNMVLDRRAVEGEGPLITLRAKHIPAARALELVVVRFSKLQMEGIEGGVFISDAAHMLQRPRLRTYDVRDQVAPPAADQESQEEVLKRATALVSSVVQFVEPETWLTATVDGTAVEVPIEAENARGSLLYRDGALAVSQTRNGHRLLQELLGALRGDRPAAEQTEPEWVQIALQNKASVDFTETPLTDVLAFLHDVGGINILLAPNSTGDKTPAITLKARDMRLETLLDLIVRRLAGMDYAIRDNALVVASQGSLDYTYEMRVHDVRDLLVPHAGSSDQSKAAESLVRSIVFFVQPHSWWFVTVGGKPVDPLGEPEDKYGRALCWDHRLVIWQTRPVHQAVSDLLERLRQGGEPGR